MDTQLNTTLLDEPTNLARVQSLVGKASSSNAFEKQKEQVEISPGSDHNLSSSEPLYVHPTYKVPVSTKHQYVFTANSSEGTLEPGDEIHSRVIYDKKDLQHEGRGVSWYLHFVPMCGITLMPALLWWFLRCLVNLVTLLCFFAKNESISSGLEIAHTWLMKNEVERFTLWTDFFSCRSKGYGLWVWSLPVLMFGTIYLAYSQFRRRFKHRKEVRFANAMKISISILDVFVSLSALLSLCACSLKVIQLLGAWAKTRYVVTAFGEAVDGLMPKDVTFDRTIAAEIASFSLSHKQQIAAANVTSVRREKADEFAPPSEWIQSSHPESDFQETLGLLEMEYMCLNPDKTKSPKSRDHGIALLAILGYRMETYNLTMSYAATIRQAYDNLVGVVSCMTKIDPIDPAVAFIHKSANRWFSIFLPDADFFSLPVELGNSLKTRIAKKVAFLVTILKFIVRTYVHVWMFFCGDTTVTFELLFCGLAIAIGVFLGYLAARINFVPRLWNWCTSIGESVPESAAALNTQPRVLNFCIPKGGVKEPFSFVSMWYKGPQLVFDHTTGFFLPGIAWVFLDPVSKKRIPLSELLKPGVLGKVVLFDATPVLSKEGKGYTRLKRARKQKHGRGSAPPQDFEEELDIDYRKINQSEWRYVDEPDISFRANPKLNPALVAINKKIHQLMTPKKFGTFARSKIDWTDEQSIERALLEQQLQEEEERIHGRESLHATGQVLNLIPATVPSNPVLPQPKRPAVPLQDRVLARESYAAIAKKRRVVPAETHEQEPVIPVIPTARQRRNRSRTLRRRSLVPLVPATIVPEKESVGFASGKPNVPFPSIPASSPDAKVKINEARIPGSFPMSPEQHKKSTIPLYNSDKQFIGNGFGVGQVLATAMHVHVMHGGKIFYMDKGKLVPLKLIRNYEDRDVSFFEKPPSLASVPTAVGFNNKTNGVLVQWQTFNDRWDLYFSPGALQRLGGEGSHDGDHLCSSDYGTSGAPLYWNGTCVGIHTGHVEGEQRNTWTIWTTPILSDAAIGKGDGSLGN